jgi:hypothetical protein
VNAEGLAPVVVFAAARLPGDQPDVAVGLALAAHMARKDRPVSLVVIPRYLEADPKLEKDLRERRGQVTGGVVLGRTEVLPDDTRALLRQVITSTRRSGPLGALQSAVGSLETLLAAVVALLGAGAASQGVREFNRQRKEGRFRMSPPVGPESEEKPKRVSRHPRVRR